MYLLISYIDLINMDQGFGVRARNIRKTLLSTFITTYKLKTLSQGAVVREWPNKFTVWKEGCSDRICIFRFII